MVNILKTGIFILLCIVLALPLLQNTFAFVKSGPLHGVFKSAPDVEFAWGKWFDGSYQDGKGKYVNDNIGFRPDLIRLNNEIDFDCFKKIHSEWRLLGDNSCIFQDVYVYSYLGRDYDGYAYIAEKVRKMKAIQDTLQKLGKTFIFVQSPCKAFFYPEYIPAEFRRAPKSTTNFETYKRLADSVGLNQVDFNTWLTSMKKSSKELLYPRQGFHWSEYGSLLAADSLIRYIERHQKIHMLHPVWTDVVHTKNARYDDNDIAKTMNLVFPLADETFSYPEVQFSGDKTARKPNIIYIGDSFLFQWVNEGVLANTENNWQIWYYDENLINRDFSVQVNHSLYGYDKFSQIDQADCIVLMYTSRNLSKLGNKFIEDTYSHFFSGK